MDNSFSGVVTRKLKFRLKLGLYSATYKRTVYSSTDCRIWPMARQIIFPDRILREVPMRCMNSIPGRPQVAVEFNRDVVYCVVGDRCAKSEVRL